jgi:hypothetical protein
MNKYFDNKKDELDAKWDEMDIVFNSAFSASKYVDINMTVAEPLLIDSWNRKTAKGLEIALE